MERKYIAYYRVSTKEQGISNLGIQAQQQQVLNFVGCKECILQEYTEIESGKNNNRPELSKAITTAKQTGATLVIAKLDRLSRNLSFITLLMESGVKFQCADMPEATEFTIHIFGALAQQERKLNSERTKRALDIKKHQGVTLGKPENLNAAARLKGLEKRQANARNNENNKRASVLIKSLRKEGLTFEAIAKELNNNGYKTSKGKEFKPIQVQRLSV